MKIKLGELDIILESMNKLIQKEMPVKASFLFGRLFKKLAEEYALFDSDRKKLLIKYCELDENDEVKIKDNLAFFKSDEDANNFNKDILELSNLEIEIDWEPIEIDNLGDIEITPKDLINLNYFFA